jgi:hypothetical protein
MRTISSKDAAAKGAREDDGRRVLPEHKPHPPRDPHLAALDRIGQQLQAMAEKPVADPALRALLVELAAQTAAVAELVAELGRSRPQAAPITSLKITARDANDRIQSIAVIRGH